MTRTLYSFHSAEISQGTRQRSIHLHLTAIPFSMVGDRNNLDEALAKLQPLFRN